MTVKRAVVTGATGMIGVNLIQQLIERKIEVLAICNPKSSRIQNIPEHSYIKKIKVSLKELDQVNEEIKYDICFHLGWEATSNCQRNAIEIQESNIAYTLKAIHMAKRLGCHSFIGGGSQAEYGRKSSPLNGEMAVHPENAYGIAKYTAGRLGEGLAKQLGLRYIWTRILSVYGPGDGKNTMISYVIRELLEGREPKLTLGEQIWDYIYCEDAARALLLIGEYGHNQKIYCIGSGHTRTIKEYVECIRDRINPKLELNFGTKPYSEEQVMYLCADISELTRDTGFEPQIRFEEGCEKTIHYCRNQMKKG